MAASGGHRYHRRQTELPDGTPTASANRRPVLILLFSFLFLGLVACVVAGVAVSRARAGAGDTPAHGILRSACSSTLYPDLCYSTIAGSPSLLATIAGQKDVIHGAINLSRTAVQHSYFTVQKLRDGRGPGLSERERVALHDCLEMFDDTLDELRKAAADLDEYSPKAAGTRSLRRHAADLETLLSAAMTNQESCLEGFSHDGADRRVRKGLEGAVEHVSQMCSNALAMVVNMTNGDIAMAAAAENGTASLHRRLLDADGEGFRFPSWMTAADRRLLQSSNVTADVVVAADGSGDYKSVSEAVAAAPAKSDRRYVIRIKAGTYDENVDVPKKKTNLMFVGDDRQTTIITGSRNVVDGATTFKSATVAVAGGGFLARDLTFQNTAGPSKHQAVALRVGSDQSAFYRCNIIGYQDTLYVHSLRQFFRDCYISGTVDFIFGNAAAMLQNCHIQVRRPDPGQKNMVTAQGRNDPNQNTGIVVQGCTIDAAADLAGAAGSFPSYLGRPWKPYSRTVIMTSTIAGVIDPAGWHEWSGSLHLETLTYREYQNAGDGAGTGGRVKWTGYKVITGAEEAREYSPDNFISGSGWLASTGFPFSLGV